MLNALTDGTNQFLASLGKSRLDGVRLLFDKEVYATRDQMVYIRPCYEKLYDKINQNLLIGEKCVVTGTPGIGKSMFGYYAMHRLLDQGITVIYIYMGWACCHLYVPQSPSKLVMETLARLDIPVAETTDGERWLGRFIPEGIATLVEDSMALYSALVELIGDVVVIVDPPRVWGADLFKNPKCGLLMVTSPTPERTTAVKSEGDAFTLYMPLWSSDEIKNLVRARKNGVDLTEEEKMQLELRELRFGSIPRYIAQVKHDHSQMLAIGDNETKNIIKALSSTKMYEITNPMSVNPDISGRIIHIEVVNDQLDSFRKRFASEMIERQILVHFHRSERHSWSAFAACVRDVKGFAAMVGVQSEIGGIPLCKLEENLVSNNFS